MESTRKVTSEMGLAVHGDLGQFQINTFLTLKFLPIDSDWAVTRSHFPTREQCWRVEFLDSTWAANCAGAIVLSLAFHQDIVDFSYFHIAAINLAECWCLGLQVKLEDVFPMVAGQHMGSPFSHSAHIYQSRFHDICSFSLSLCHLWFLMITHILPGPYLTITIDTIFVSF